MTIKTIRVVSKYIRTCERFTEFLQENIRWVEGDLLNTVSLDPVMFALNNVQHLKMHVQGNDNDLLALTVYGGMSPHVTVTYLEKMYDDGEDYFSPLATEDFPRAELAKAIECFMERWYSANPEKATSPKVRNSRQAIVDFMLKPLHELPVRLHVPVDFTWTPEQIRERLTLQRWTYAIYKTECHKDQQQFSIEHHRGHMSHAVKRSVDNLPDVSDMEVIFEDGKLIGKYAVVAPDTNEPMQLSVRLKEAFDTLSKDNHVLGNKVQSVRVGYTGDKNNHGTGSLDHIEW